MARAPEEAIDGEGDIVDGDHARMPVLGSVRGWRQSARRHTAPNHGACIDGVDAFDTPKADSTIIH